MFYKYAKYLCSMIDINWDMTRGKLGWNASRISRRPSVRCPSSYFRNLVLWCLYLPYPYPYFILPPTPLPFPTQAVDVRSPTTHHRFYMIPWPCLDWNFPLGMISIGLKCDSTRNDAQSRLEFDKVTANQGLNLTPRCSRVAAGYKCRCRGSPWNRFTVHWL